MSRILLLAAVFALSACASILPQERLSQFLDGEKKVEAPLENESDEESKGGFWSDWFDNEEDELFDSQGEPEQDNQDELLAEDEAEVDQLALACRASEYVGYSYRKRVAMLPMAIARRHQAVDLPLIETQYPQMLVHRLPSERLIAADATSTAIPRPRYEQAVSAAAWAPSDVRRIAKKLNAQFLVTGRFMDMSFSRADADLGGLVTSTGEWRTLGRQLYQANTGSYLRQFQADLQIYDGPSGALLRTQRFSGEADHKVSTASSSGLDSNGFWKTDYGELLAGIQQQQANVIAEALDCLPMRAQVSLVKDRFLEINVGVEAKILPGDRLKLFHREPAGIARDGTREYRWQYFGEVTIAGVFPMRAIAQLDMGLPIGIVQPGDIIQAW